MIVSRCPFRVDTESALAGAAVATRRRVALPITRGRIAPLVMASLMAALWIVTLPALAAESAEPDNAASCGDCTPSEAAARRVDRANAQVQAGRTTAAMEGYREALALDPDYLPARVNLATLYNRQGETEQSQALLRAGLALPEAPKADRGHLAYLLALSLAEQGDLDSALEWLDRDTQWRPTHARTYYNQALLLDRLGRQEAALDALHKGLYLAPESPDLLYAAVYLNATQGHVSRALAVMETLRRVAPDDPQLDRLERQLQGQSAP
ncbi:tetratricopeptide repeat protein [Salinicola aestuarinus]|uniref:tetratricopeptide repeat protein n=1 Tax=Salinicola aestuarinus TaxID=1949082 RepID=UPI000DA246FD|nr:tetratricopeptide repeat protein [Salinicola aestuarinus]